MWHHIDRKAIIFSGINLLLYLSQWRVQINTVAKGNSLKKTLFNVVVMTSKDIKFYEHDIVKVSIPSNFRNLFSINVHPFLFLCNILIKRQHSKRKINTGF